MLLTPEALVTRFPELECAERIVVAFSGGLDSHVLLHLLSELRSSHSSPIRLEAIHIHHGVNDQADDWVLHCQEVCEQLRIPLSVEPVSLKSTQASLENQLREARYQLFAKQLKQNELLVLAHHADDQAETLLLRQLRGAGPQGLSGMPVSRPLGQGVLLRPLLSFSRPDLELYAKQHQLVWIEDDSNADTRFDRNFLRHEIMPKLEERWPHFRQTFARNAQVSAESDLVLSYFLERELAPVMTGNKSGLSCAWLKSHNPELQRNLLRAWFKKLELPLPGYKHLQQIIDEVVNAVDDAAPLLKWPGVEVRRFQGVVYAFQALTEHDDSGIHSWDLSQDLVLPGAGKLTAERTEGNGLAIPEGTTVTVAFRQGGERCQVAGRQHGKLLKKQLQEFHVPTWLRDRVPLVYVNNELAAVADLFVCQGFQALSGQTGYTIKWHRP